MNHIHQSCRQRMSITSNQRTSRSGQQTYLARLQYISSEIHQRTLIKNDFIQYLPHR